MRRYLAGALAALLVLLALPARAQVTTGPISPWVFGSNGLVRTLLTSSSVQVPSLANAPCLKANASGTLQSTSCGSAGSATTTINGASGPAFTFSTGTSGSDFNLTTSTGAVGFNLPTASASSRGALSTTDWSAFNAKQSALSLSNLLGTAGRVTVAGGTGAVVGSGTSVDLATTSVTAGSYTLTNVTVDAYGRITSASNGSASGGISSLNGLTTSTQLFATSTATGAFRFASSGATHTLTIPSNVGFFLNDAGYLVLGSLSAVSPLSYDSGTGAFSIALASSTANGYLSTSTFAAFNGKESPLTFSAPLSRSVNAVSIPVATSGANGYLSSTDWSTFNGKQAAGNYLTALTGDGTAAGPGSSALTLATVNANVGTFGSSSSIPTFTVNGKGLVTAASGSALNAVLSLTGTANQVIVSNSTGTVTLSAPQSIGTASSPTFGGITLGALNGNLRATAGVVSTGTVSLTTEVSGVLPIANGGTATSVAPTAGQMLIGNGSGGYSFVASSSLGASSAAGTIQVFTTSTVTSTWTKPANLKWVIIEACGGGGGGGGANRSGGTFAASAGGGGGGCGQRTLAAASLGATEVVTVGAKGTGGSGATPDAGTAGATSSLGSLLSCSGGGGGAAATNLSGTAGGTGGTCTSADVNIPGEAGNPGYFGVANVGFGGAGGSSQMGRGGNIPGSSSGTTNTAVAGTGYGAGGSGNIRQNTGGNNAGEAGTPGIVIVHEYY